VRPHGFAGLSIETESSFNACQSLGAREAAIRLFRIFVEHPIGDENLPASYGRAGIPLSDRFPPNDGQPFFGQRLDDASFAPNAVTPRTEPLRPIVRMKRARRSDEQSGGEQANGIRHSAFSENSV